jgi:predicted enzyme related to lactoylglutathione lyase
MIHRILSSALLCLLLALGGYASLCQDEATSEPAAPRVQYLEIVTPEVDATCATLAELHGVTFGDPVLEFGNARTAALAGGGKIGVRAPMRETEEPLVRTYLLVDDLDAAAQSAADAGAQLALPPMEIPGHGKFAIYIQGGVEHGLWQH